MKTQLNEYFLMCHEDWEIMGRGWCEGGNGVRREGGRREREREVGDEGGRLRERGRTELLSDSI